jgi:heme/copper-type cytochrome/quinol oxidase subunit 2
MKLFLLCCIQPEPTTNFLTEIESIANIIIAVLTFALGFYVFVYQRRKDNESKIEAEQMHRKSIKLQWFKEIIIQPRIDSVFEFYEALNKLKEDLNVPDIEDEEKIKIIGYLKLEQSKLRKSFLDLIQHINSELHKGISSNIDNLTDTITNAVSNDELKLNNSKTYEREIQTKIQSSYNDVLSKIFNYCG